MEVQFINHKNVQQFCRTCLRSFEKHLEGRKYNMTTDLCNWIHIFTSLEFLTNENYPSCICHECYDKLKSFHDFWEMCMKSNRTLDEILGKSSDDTNSEIQITMTMAKSEICDDNNTLEKYDSVYEESKGCKNSYCPENDENDDKSLITPIEINNCGSKGHKNDRTTNITETCKEILEDNKPFEYKDCSEVTVEDIKLFDTNNYLQIGTKSIPLENKTEDPTEEEQKTIKYSDKNSSRKCKSDYNDNKDATTSKNKKKSISPVKDIQNSKLEKDLKVSRGKFSCTLCTLKFYKQESLDAHIRRDHQGLKPFQCDKCGCGYNKAYRLRLHVNRIHGGNKINEEVICHIEGCGKKFRNTASYKTHYHNKHTERANLLRTFICEDCGSSFKNMISLKKHRFKHGPPEAYPFHCEQCDKRFSTKYKYKQHQDRHAGIKNFECPYCGLKKTTNDELRTHINYHTKERQWPCPDCSSVFNSSGSLGQHFRIVHQRIRRYACRYCGDSFAKPETLKHHEMRHTGEKPHECQICGKRFIQQVALRTHLKTHEKGEQKINNNLVKTAKSKI